MSANNFVLNVLTPNGRREKVIVTPNTSILQVLEDVCIKQELNSIEWDLKHYNRIVELANSVRFSGLPNNATLEMVQSHKPRIEKLVKLGLQLESGKRLMHQFSPDQNLWEVLLHWDGEGETIFPKYSEAEELIFTQPVCIYLRQEVVGKDQLQAITLKALGLTHGSACIRLIHRSESQLRHQANVSAPLSRQTTSQLQLADEEVHTSNASMPNTNIHTEMKADISKITGQYQNDNQTGTSTFPLSKEFLQSVELPVTSGKEEMPSSSSRTEISMEEDNFVEDLETHGFPAVVESLKNVAVVGQLHILGDHDAILYYADDVTRPSASADSIPDSFYDVTMADVNAMWRDLQDKRLQMENAPLQTASARSLERDTAILRNLRDHPVTIVRIRFADRYVLQGKFRTVDTVAAVENFVRQFLINRDLSFYLFTTPPKTILPSSNRLVEENLVGSAVIYFGTDEMVEQTLNPDLHELVSSPEAVQNYIRTNTEDGNPKPPIDSTTMNMTDEHHPSTSHAQPSSLPSSTNPRPSINPGSSRLNDGKVPKWFKIGK